MSMRSARLYLNLAVLGCALLTLGLGMSCGGNSSTPTPSNMTGTITTTMTDPPVCMAPMGPFQSVWVTVTKVTAHLNAQASDSDSGWQILVDLTNTPQQIDLFSLASPACVLTQLGSTTGLPPGKYQQIRIYLLDNSMQNVKGLVSSAGTNPCSGSNASGPFNCVQFPDKSVATLLLSSEAQTGLKIPPGQIQGGGISLAANQAADISINFNACASIIQDGRGGYRLKPALTAGVVSVNTNAISGTVVDRVSNAPIDLAIVLLEQPDTSVTPTIDRVRVATLTDAAGHFIFCPLTGPGPYDVVVAATTSSGGSLVTYNPTVALSVPVGTNLQSIPLVAEGTPSAPGTLSGQVTSVNSSNAAVQADVTLAALQQVAGASGNMLITVPVFGAGSQPPAVSTNTPANGALACPLNADCFDFSLSVPASQPLVATFANGSITFPPTTPATPAPYSVNAVSDECSPAGGVTSTSAVNVSAGGTASLSSVLNLTACTGP